MTRTLNLTGLKTVLLTLCLVIVAAQGAMAQGTQKVKGIRVSGNERVEETTIKSYLGINVGDVYQPAAASKALRDLYGTNLFDNVQIGWDKGVLVVEVAENPIVNQIAFENNDALDNDRLLEVVSLRPRAVFTASKIQQDVKAILAAYRQTGRYLAQVTPEIIRRSQNRVDVIFNISEGEKSKVRKIEFIGNENYASSNLRGEIATKQAAFWRFGASASYDPDKLEFDKELLRRFYLENGYADFKVVSAVAELSPDREDFFITFTIDEGQRYDFGKIDVSVSGRFPVKEAELREVITIDEGDLYNASRIDNNIDALINVLGQKGFAFLDVVPQFDKDSKRKVVNVTFDVRPGPRVYINRINIKGNTRTQENVIRREMRLVEGDAFSNTKLQRSRDRLQVLDFFDTVELQQHETAAPDRMDLDVKVREKSTGEFNIGAGFSSFEGVIGTTDLRERNFLGRGQSVVLSFALSSERRDLNLSFTEPWFLGREISAGFDVFNTRREFQEQSSFDQRDTGGAFRLGFALNEFVRNNMRLSYKETEISDVNAASSVFVQNEVGTKDSLQISNSLVYDNRDSRLMPTRGSRLEWSLSHSGFGSDIQFVRNEFLASRHVPLTDNGFVLSGALRGGHIIDIDNSTPIFENFNMGGNNLRGFDRSGIGPRDRNTADALGGQLLFGHTIELRFPIPGIKDAGVSGVVFNDGGIVTDFQQDSNPAVVDSEKYRLSAGFGLFWSSPLGPLRFEFGFPIVKADEDIEQVFSFNFGTSF